MHFPFVVEYLQASVHLSESQTTFLRTTFRKRVTLRWTCQTLEHMSGSGCILDSLKPFEDMYKMK